VESRRLEWRLGDALEAQVEHRSALDGEPRLEGIRLVGQPLAAEYCLPEPAQPLRLDGVDDEVLQIHAPTVGPAGVDIASHDTTLAPMPPAMSRRLLAVNTAACRMRIHCANGAHDRASATPRRSRVTSRRTQLSMSVCNRDDPAGIHWRAERRAPDRQARKSAAPSCG